MIPHKGASAAWRMVEKPHIGQHGEERANVVYFGDSLKLCETMSFQNMTLTKERPQSLLREIKLQSFATCKLRVLKLEKKRIINARYHVPA